MERSSGLMTILDLAATGILAESAAGGCPLFEVRAEVGHETYSNNDNQPNNQLPVLSTKLDNRQFSVKCNGVNCPLATGCIVYKEGVTMGFENFLPDSEG